MMKDRTDYLLVSLLSPLLRPARVPLSSICSCAVAGESLGTEGGVAVIEEHSRVAAAHDGGDLGSLGTLARGTVRETNSLVPGLGEGETGQRQRIKTFTAL